MPVAPFPHIRLRNRKVTVAVRPQPYPANTQTTHSHGPGCPGSGFVPGAPVVAIRGLLSAEALMPGDRVITWEGSRMLSSVSLAVTNRPLIGLPTGFFGATQPMWLDPDQQLLLHGSRLRERRMQRAVRVRAGDLAFLPFVESAPVARVRLAAFRMHPPSELTVAGLWLASCTCGSGCHGADTAQTGGDRNESLVPMLERADVHRLLDGMTL